MHPGIFSLFLSKVIRSFRERIAQEDKFAHMWSKSSGLYKEYEETKELLKWLELKDAGDESTINWTGEVRDLIWSSCSSLIYKGSYKSVACPGCNSSYKPASMTKVEWRYGEELAASGGYRLVCPRGHTVYAIMEWNS